MNSNESIRNFTTFDHVEADKRGREFWANFYKTFDEKQSLKESLKEKESEFRMIMPPPNVTGVLHLGHTITITIEDVIARYNMLKGKKIRWIPGTDHAGIATQVVVEKDLKKETGLSRHDLGREAFLKRVWEWKNKNASTIIEQLKVLSPILDYSNEQFTMSDDLSKEVTKAFVELYRRGKIFRADRMVEYCCELQTVISNIEIDHIDIDGPSKHSCPNGVIAEVGRMYDIIYEVDYSTINSTINSTVNSTINSTNDIKSITISTTRPETMFGDMCIAVHPNDPRYQNLSGIRFKIPFTNRTIPLIYDSQLPNPEMGTGAVKVTPAHDVKDYDLYIRRKSDLKISNFIDVIDNLGNISFESLLKEDPNSLTSEIRENINGKNRYIARKIIVKMLEDANLLKNVRSHKTTLNVCSRTGDILEPMLRSQWFINTTDMCKRSIEVVDNNELLILDNTGGSSEIHRNTWKRFLEDGRPWCISRQLWWGHQIPAYRIQITSEGYSNHQIQSEWIVEETEEIAYIQAQRMMKDYALREEEINFELVQDSDVLDTWFSSGIYPFTIMNGSVFPQNILETGKDILFFWVARMVMLSLELKNQLPFSKVFLHNMVRDKEGRKMSKSLGNVIDPLDVINGITQRDMIIRIENSNLSKNEMKIAVQNIKKHFPQGIKSYGVDSLRMGLLYYLRQDSDINLNVDIFKSAHSLLNKVWQILNLLEILQQESEKNSIVSDNESSIEMKIIQPLKDWIDSKEVENLNFEFVENYDLSQIYESFQSYIMNYFAPSYLEVVKVVITDKNNYYKLSDVSRKSLISHLLEKITNIIRFLHPMAPNATLIMADRLGLSIQDLIMKNENSDLKSVSKINNFDEVLEVVSIINSIKNREINIPINWTESDNTLEIWTPIVSHLTRTNVKFTISDLCVTRVKRLKIE